MSNFLKKSWYNICGTADFFRSRIQTKPSAWVARTVIAVTVSTGIGAILADHEQDNANNWDAIESERAQWINDNADFKPVGSVVNFPKICGLGDSWYFAAKAPNGDYSLYAGNSGFYAPVEADQLDNFVERYQACIEATRALDEQQAHFHVDFTRSVSQPLRSDNTLRDGAYSFRRLSSEKGNGFDGNMAELTNLSDSEDRAFKDLDASWSDAIESFEDGDVYDHANASDVKTFEYAYEEPAFPISVVFHFMMVGALVGAGASVFSGKPNDAAKERAARRDTKRQMLNHDDLQF
tara:strand:- start:30253 stop:31134 length:882 start_codon:yes stop_codon:yes gene_type:complete